MEQLALQAYVAVLLLTAGWARGAGTANRCDLMPPPSELAEGDSLVLYCGRYNKHNATAYFYKDGKRMRTTSSGNVHHHSITFTRLNLDDIGSYTCSSSDGQCSRSKPFLLHVVAKLVLRSIGPQTLTVTSGSTLRLEAEVVNFHSARKFHVKWYKDGLASFEMDRVDVSEKKGTLVFRRLNMLLADNGQYVVGTFNIAGSKAITFNVTVSVASTTSPPISSSYSSTSNSPTTIPGLDKSTDFSTKKTATITTTQKDSDSKGMVNHFELRIWLCLLGLLWY
eukprot:m.15836 g.15836  ORF g.15836 m.15836 type:complete len:281 (+) comp26579_c0_seq2:78-920(+)